MAIGLVFDAKGVTQAQYDQVRKVVSPNNKLPPGMLYHAGGPTQTGWTVVEIWESQEAASRFFDGGLSAALKDAKIEVQPRPFEVHNIMTP